MFILGMDYVDPKRKSNYVGKIFLAAALTALCIIMIKRSPSLNPPSPVILHRLTPSNTHDYHSQLCVYACLNIFMLYFLLCVFVFYLIHLFINTQMTEWNVKDDAIHSLRPVSLVSIIELFFLTGWWWEKWSLKIYLIS